MMSWWASSSNSIGSVGSHWSMANADGGTVVPKMTLRIHYVPASSSFGIATSWLDQSPSSTFAESETEPEVSSQFAWSPHWPPRPHWSSGPCLHSPLGGLALYGSDTTSECVELRLHIRILFWLFSCKHFSAGTSSMQSLSDNTFLTRPKTWRFKNSALVHTNQDTNSMILRTTRMNMNVHPITHAI